MANDWAQRDFGPDKFDRIPPHGRWQHFDIGNVPRVDQLIGKWEIAGCDKLEVTRRLVDLFFISVLLDAGAGDLWKFTEPGTGQAYGRSEGIAVASMYMMTAGAFSGQTRNLLRVDGERSNGDISYTIPNALTQTALIRTRPGCFDGRHIQEAFSDQHRESNSQRHFACQPAKQRRCIAIGAAEILWPGRPAWTARW